MLQALEIRLTRELRLKYTVNNDPSQYPHSIKHGAISFADTESIVVGNEELVEVSEEQTYRQAPQEMSGHDPPHEIDPVKIGTRRNRRQ